MSNSPQKNSAGSMILGIVVGIALMVGGMWLSKNWHPEFIANLEAQGIPLDLGKTISIIGVFLILFPVIKFFFITPLASAIGERSRDLEQTFGEAEALRQEMAQMRTDYERRLTETEAQAREQIQAQIKEAQNLRQSLMAEAAQRADEMVAKAQEEITAEKERLLNELRIHVVDLTLAAAEKVLVENMDSDKNRRLVEDFINRVEVAP